MERSSLVSSAANTTKKVFAAFALVLVSGMGPCIVLALLGLPNLANAAILPGMALTIACITGTGWRGGIIVVGPFAVFCALAAWASPSPWLAAIVLAVAAFLRAYAARAGLHNALTVTVITLGFLVATPYQFDSVVPTPILVGVVSLGAGLWAIIVSFALRKWIPHVKRVHVERIRVLVYSILFAVLVGAATLLVVHFNLGQTGAWIILTILVVFQPYFGAGFKKAGARAFGTVVGLCITVVIGVFFPSGPILYVIGSIFGMIILLFLFQNRPYWMYAMALTPTVVLFNSANTNVGIVAIERLKGTFVGIALTLLVMLALLPISKRLEVKPTTPSQ
jgi:hypothetical protein